MSDKVQKIAAHGLIKNKNKYLITRRSLLNDYKPGEWDLPGGTIEFGEDPLRALDREILEEASLKVKVVKPLYIYSFISNPSRHQFQIVYECNYLGGEVKLNPKEHDKFIWATIPKIGKLHKIAFLKSFYTMFLLRD
jgi:8-oxo-dGTP pyrophosphatase MutT (NUDIX family)